MVLSCMENPSLVNQSLVGGLVKVFARVFNITGSRSRVAERKGTKLVVAGS